MNPAGSGDLPAAFDYITSSTGASKIFFVSHSMGSSEFLATASQQPQIQDKLHAAFLMAPPAYFDHMEGALAQLAPYENLIDNLLQATGHWELFPDNPLTSEVK